MTVRLSPLLAWTGVACEETDPSGHPPPPWQSWFHACGAHHRLFDGPYHSRDAGRDRDQPSAINQPNHDPSPAP